MKILMVSLIFIGASAWATEKKLQTLQKEMSFEDLLVQGKYHFSDEAVTPVEDDKILDALLPVRKDFKERIERSASRH